MKKLFCALLSLTMLLGLGTVALAADEDVSTESTLGVIMPCGDLYDQTISVS